MKKHLTTVIAVAAGLVVVALFFGTDMLRLFTAAPGTNTGTSVNMRDRNAVANITVPPGSLSEIAPGVKIFDVAVGTGEEAKSGRTIALHYAGTFLDGSKFDSSFDRGQPLVFVLGGGRIISGMESGLAGMRVGGKRHLVISPDRAYGHAGIPGPNGTYIIPPDSTLVFDVLLVGVNQ